MKVPLLLEGEPLVVEGKVDWAETLNVAVKRRVRRAALLGSLVGVAGGVLVNVILGMLS